MPFLKGPVTFQRFRINGPKPLLFGEEHLARLRSLAGGVGKKTLAGSVSVGWTAGESVLDTDFNELKNVYPDHLAWDMWVETNKIPPELFKAYYRADLAALAKGNPSGRPSAKQKREARGSAADRLHEEARDGRFLKRTAIPVLWDAVRNEIFFGSASPNQADRFARLFLETFNADLFHPVAFAKSLSPINAHTLAVAIDGEVEGVSLTSLVSGVRFPEGPAWCPSEKDVSFLGNEFLVWLWHQADEGVEDGIDTPDGSKVTFMFSGELRLECPFGSHGNDTINHDSAIRTPSARAALRAGMLPRKACLTVVRNNDQYRFKFAAETLAVTAAKLPNPDGSVTGRDLELHRLAAVRDLAETIEQLFAAFLKVRLSEPAWDQETDRIRAWTKRLAGASKTRT